MHSGNGKILNIHVFTIKANENKEMWKAKQQEAEKALALTQMLDAIQLYSY